MHRSTRKSLCRLSTLYQPMTHICVMSSHKPIRIYIGVLILGVNTLYRLFCFFKLFLMVGKGLIEVSRGWLWQFCIHHGVRQLSLQGEKLSFDTTALEPSKEQLQKLFYREGEPYTRNIYN